MPGPVTMSATLAAEEILHHRRLAGQQVLSLASGEIGLPVHPTLKSELAAAAGHNAYGQVAGSVALRTAVAGYWQRRGLDVGPDRVVSGPGSKALIFAVLMAIGGDVAIPVPSWVSYAAHIQLIGAQPVPVPILPGQGGVPEPDRLRDAVLAARTAGRDVRAVVVTIPDNPTGTIASPEIVRWLAEVARELDLVIVSDEIYCDLVFDGTDPAISPAVFAPERTVVTTGLTKSLALGGWRTGVARLPDDQLRDRLLTIASQIWSSPPAPVQAAAAYAFGEPPELVAYIASARRLHEAVVRALSGRFSEAGVLVLPVRATCYLYPDFEPFRAHLAQVHGIHTGSELTTWLLDWHGVGVLPASAFGEPAESLRIRVSTSHLYGDTDEQCTAALIADDPLALRWIRSSVDRVEESLSDLLATKKAFP
jgi:aspartate aminotransferase